MENVGPVRPKDAPQMRAHPEIPFAAQTQFAHVGAEPAGIASERTRATGADHGHLVVAHQLAHECHKLSFRAAGI